MDTVGLQPHEAPGESPAVAKGRYRTSLRRCAHRLAELDALRDGIDLDEATGILSKQGGRRPDE